jgi:hypothetical protein
MKNRLFVVILIPAVALGGCSGYKSQFVSFKPPAAYENQQSISGAVLGGEAFVDKSEAEKAFGFNIRGAGLLPVMLVMENKSPYGMEVVSNQTFLVDESGNYWPLMPNYTAIDRVEKSTELASFFGSGAGKGATIGAVAGTVLGAALGVVSGKNVASSLGKGAAIGAAGGAVMGGTKEGTSGERERRITTDLRDKGLEGKVIPMGSLAHGFLYFPGEATSAREVRLQVREKETGIIHTVLLSLKQK